MESGEWEVRSGKGGVGSEEWAVGSGELAVPTKPQPDLNPNSRQWGVGSGKQEKSHWPLPTNKFISGKKETAIIIFSRLEGSWRP